MYEETVLVKGRDLIDEAKRMVPSLFALMLVFTEMPEIFRCGKF